MNNKTEATPTSRPLIFVTNDDGFYAYGIRNLIDIVRQYGDVVAVAPERSESGMSHAITIRKPLRLKKISSEEGFEFYRCNGTPVDCVKIGLDRVVTRKPDILVSGINHGSNSSVSVFYSGTMAAALEGCINKITSIGFSLLDHSSNANFAPSLKYVETIFSTILKNGLPRNVCLNVNIPNVSSDEIKGIKVCRQTDGIWKEEFDRRLDPYNEEYFWLTGDYKNLEPDKTDTDEWALANNYISVVPVKIDITSYDTLEVLQGLNK